MDVHTTDSDVLLESQNGLSEAGAQYNGDDTMSRIFAQRENSIESWFRSGALRVWRCLM